MFGIKIIKLAKVPWADAMHASMVDLRVKNAHTHTHMRPATSTRSLSTHIGGGCQTRIHVSSVVCLNVFEYF